MQNHDESQNLLSSKEALHLAKWDESRLEELLAAMHGSELGELLLACRKDSERQTLIEYIPDELLGEALLELPERMQEELLADFRADEVEDMVEHLNSDDAADILQVVDKGVASEVIEQLDPSERREIEQLLTHDEESAGGLMQAELFKVRHNWSVEKVLQVLRRFGREIENLNYVYVVDDEDKLTGVLSLHAILFAEPEVIVSGIAKADFPRALAGQDQEEVAHIFERYDVLALPVVDEQGVLIGRITADDVIDVIQDEATEDMFRLAALSDDDDLAESVGTTARRRGVWLALNLVTAIAASFVIAQFEATIAKVVALAVLMPIVASMGGIAGTQTLTVIVRGIALGRVTFDNARRTLVKEVSVGMVSGLAFALVIGTIASFWFPDLGIRLGWIIAAAMMVNLFAAALAGSVIPLTLQRLNVDPALASGTILTTVTDVVGFFSFLGLATLFLI
ncbi:magnesium transporter [Mariprofundus ferrinatatus]|uniref:Magnesium transporter MgtE n=1 Tax=Mariprofundus ferrinatatus TaxID=1921087 RepID=A0A2K8L1Z6_9PROT|nr:magnesium transporter [Mariprofundus ferrinatatus]ATX81350.1 magnesium transporter [Mariprofundus ferrinatatus]